MAATRLIPMHLQKSRSMGQCLKERTDYAKNDEKTEAGQFVSSYLLLLWNMDPAPAKHPGSHLRSGLQFYPDVLLLLILM